MIEWKNCNNFFLIHEQKSAEIFSDNRRSCDINQLGTAQTKRLFFFLLFCENFRSIKWRQKNFDRTFQIFFCANKKNTNWEKMKNEIFGFKKIKNKIGYYTPKYVFCFQRHMTLWETAGGIVYADNLKHKKTDDTFSLALEFTLAKPNILNMRTGNFGYNSTTTHELNR